MEKALKALGEILEESSKSAGNEREGKSGLPSGSPHIPGITPWSVDNTNREVPPNLYLTALDDLKIGVAVTEGTRFVHVSKALCAMYGYTKVELLGLQSYFQLIPREEQSSLAKRSKTRRAGTSPSSQGETTVIRRDGRQIRIEYWMREFDHNGQTQIYSFIRDITERQLSETKSRLLASAVESTSEIITITDSQNRFFFLNKAFLDTYGYSEVEVLGKGPGILSPGDRGDLIADQIWRRTQTGKWSGQLLNKRKDGTLFPIHLSTSPIVDDEGNILGYIGVGRDITELNEAERTLLEAEERFQMLFAEQTRAPLHRNEAFTPLTCEAPKVMNTLAQHIHSTLDTVEARIQQVLNFSSFASHELRTPLTIMRSSLELAMDKDTPVSELRGSLSRVYDEVLRLNHMVGMLMDIGRMQAGSLKLELCDINLADFMREFCHDARLLCKQKNIEFMLGTIPVVHVEADPHYLRQVFFNLLDNSCKHSPVGGRISLDYAVSDSQVLIRFSDTGSGISPDDLPNIFEPFFKGSQGNSGNLTGAGLGLALVRWVVEALRGSITAQSQAGAWSAFEIRLPVFRPSDL